MMFVGKGAEVGADLRKNHLCGAAKPRVPLHASHATEPWGKNELPISPERAKQKEVSPFQGLFPPNHYPGFRLLRSLTLGFAAPRFQR